MTNNEKEVTTDTRVYRLFCAALLAAVLTNVSEQTTLLWVNDFYNAVSEYDAYAAKVEINQKKKPRVTAFISTSRSPDYDYASRMTGIYGETMKNIERLYIDAQHMPESQNGKILERCKRQAELEEREEH